MTSQLAPPSDDETTTATASPVDESAPESDDDDDATVAEAEANPAPLTADQVDDPIARIGSAPDAGDDDGGGDPEEETLYPRELKDHIVAWGKHEGPVKLRNLTPCPVQLGDLGLSSELAMHDLPAPALIEAPVGEWPIEGLPIPIRMVWCRRVENLPAPEPGVFLIVENEIRNAMSERPDLLSPCDPVVNAKGLVEYRALRSCSPFGPLNDPLFG